MEDDIFKENMRYFSDPILFLSKSIDELQSLDYSNINKVLKGEEISFAEYSEKISPNNFFNQLSNVDAKIKHYINIIEIAKKRLIITIQRILKIFLFIEVCLIILLNLS